MQLDKNTHSRRPAGTTRGRLEWVAGWASWLQPSPQRTTDITHWIFLPDRNPSGGFHPRSSASVEPFPNRNGYRKCPTTRCEVFFQKRKKLGSSFFVKTKEQRLRRTGRLEGASWTVHFKGRVWKFSVVCVWHRWRHNPVLSYGYWYYSHRGRWTGLKCAKR